VWLEPQIMESPGCYSILLSVYLGLTWASKYVIFRGTSLPMGEFLLLSFWIQIISVKSCRRKINRSVVPYIGRYSASHNIAGHHARCLACYRNPM
jgi:hypothetical protein